MTRIEIENQIKEENNRLAELRVKRNQLRAIDAMTSVTKFCDTLSLVKYARSTITNVSTQNFIAASAVYLVKNIGTATLRTLLDMKKEELTNGISEAKYVEDYEKYMKELNYDIIDAKRNIQDLQNELAETVEESVNEASTVDETPTEEATAETANEVEETATESAANANPAFA
jgi:DNA repair exonuclease SbcCD ATPase subunit